MAEIKSRNDIINMMEVWFKKAPALPANAKQTLVNITPWIALIFGVLGIITGLGLAGGSSIAMLGGIGNSTIIRLGGVITIIASAMMLMAYPKLKALQMSGWTLLFWSSVVSLIGSLVMGSIVSALIWGVIEFYILFQIKSYYK